MADLKRDKRKLLGQFLLDSGVVTKEQIQKAIEEQKKVGNRIGKVLLDLGFISEKDLRVALGKQLNLPHIDLFQYDLKPEIVSLIPEPVARRYELIALEKVNDTLTVAIVDPLNLFAIDEVQRITKCRVEPMICSASAITPALDKGYRKEEKTALRPQAVAGLTGEEIEMETVEVGPEVIELVNAMIDLAARERASDIHIEPEEENIRVRLRIDGVLHEIRTFSKESGPAIVSRVKVLAGLDIAEKRIPQDGRFRIVLNGRDIDLRISTLPTIFGEKVAMRLLDKSVILIELEQLGFQPETLNRFQELIRKPYGIILVTGPTSSGKTTTLYAGLHTINSIDKNIITVEDPVEFHLKSVNQVQVNPRTGLTFATGLRSILRQDPNIIMVGEIRDLETAEIAIQSALTGHLVFSTIHTNNAPATLNRLIDMKVEPFLIASSIVGILAQRLIRLLCHHCKEPYNPPPDLIKTLGLPSYGTVFTFYHGKGCDKCKGTGYLGRTGIFEFMTINDQIRDLIISKAPTSAIRQSARRNGMQTLREDGLQKVLKGQTTIEEVMRATVEEEA